MRNILILRTPGGELESLAIAFTHVAGEESHARMLTGVDSLIDELDRPEHWDAVFVDYALGDGKVSGRDCIARIRKADEGVPIVAVAEKADVFVVSMAVFNGATHFLVRGADLEERVRTLLLKARHVARLHEVNRSLAEQNRQLRETLAERHSIVGESPAISELRERIRRVAKIPRPVLLLGERGTGKELVARAIHAEAGHEPGSLVTVNCAAFSEDLLENELFGHEKGGYTGAAETSAGRFERAEDGTLFLDEIGHMSTAFQQKILRVVEYGTFTRVGGSEEIRTNTRIIAATNADLEALMDSGAFLRDLYDRLAFEVIRVPPLRERQGDIELLAQHFLNRFMYEVPVLRGKCLAPSAIDALRRYSFPGNVRELKNLIERGAYRDETQAITCEDLGLPAETREKPSGAFHDRVEAFKRALVIEALEAAGGNQAQAARDLGIPYHQFRYYYAKLAEGDRRPA